MLDNTGSYQMRPLDSGMGHFPIQWITLPMQFLKFSQRIGYS